MRLQVMTLAMVFAMSSAGCGKKDEAAAGDKKPAGPTIAELTTQVKKALPKASEGISWEAKAVGRKGKTAAAIPVGWEESKHMEGMFKPPKAADLGFLTAYTVSNTCGGACEAQPAKAWAAKAGKRFERFKTDQFEVISDKATDTSRAVLAKTKNGKTAHIAVAKWREGGSRYYTCESTLSDKGAALQDAVLAACLAGTGTYLY